ncbi:MAG: ATP-binding protein, partial [Pseudomonadota bacterium]
AMMTTLRPRDEVEGSGLGLAIARKALKLMGGEISLIDPPEGKGTAVEFTLPASAIPRGNR